MKYSVSEAMKFSEKNELDKWLQLFLRDDSYEHASPNIALADGLLLEERFYLGPILIDLDKLTTKRIEKDIKDENDLKYYKEVVDSMFKNYSNYNFPPFIVEYKDDKLYLTDGNHRYSALRKLGIDKYYVIIWGSKILEKEFKMR